MTSCLLSGDFTASWRYRSYDNNSLLVQVVDILKMFTIKVSMIVIYPFYNYMFTSLPPTDQAWVSLFLIVIKRNQPLRAVQDGHATRGRHSQC